MSTTIYSAILPVISKDKNIHNYVYQITELSTGMKYIGSHGTEKSNALKDLKKYKSSAKEFKKKQILNPLNYHYEILSYHETRDEATLEESRLHLLYDVKCHNGYYNLSNQTANGFSVNGKTNVKDKFGNILFINCDDPRFLSGELVSINKDKAIVKDSEGTTLQVDKDDPRYLSGELVGIAKGKVNVKDKDGNTMQVDINDHRYLSGELKPTACGMINVKDKYGNKSYISNTDPQYLNGDVICESSKWVNIDGILYAPIIIMKQYKLSKYLLNKRCKSGDWFYAF